MFDYNESRVRATARLSVLAALTISTSVPLGAQSQPARPQFEVASVHPLPDAFPTRRPGPLTVSSPLIRMQGYTLFGLIMDAWHLRDFQLRFAPSISKEAVYNTMYDVIARSPGQKVPDINDVRLMLQDLLATRFQLTLHHETEERPVYILQVGKNGPKLKASTSSSPCSLRVGVAGDGRNDEEIFTSCPIERLVDRVKGPLDDRPVLDRTGLTGRYDIDLVALSPNRARAQADPLDIDVISALGGLGLKLVPDRALIDIVVVDHIEKPAEN